MCAMAIIYLASERRFNIRYEQGKIFVLASFCYTRDGGLIGHNKKTGWFMRLTSMALFNAAALVPTPYSAAFMDNIGSTATLRA